jgi:alpha-tubulin suppressor-like RCC1 family protein/uncharacterized protein YjdB
LLTVVFGVCALNNCILPSGTVSSANIRFDLGLTGPLRVPLNGKVTPSIDILLDGRVMRGGQYRLESLNRQVATVDATGRVVTGVQRDTTSVRVVFLSGVTGATAPDTVIPILVVVSEVVVKSEKNVLGWGETVKLDATGHDALGEPVLGLTYKWNSSNESVVIVDTAGYATGVLGASDEAVITAEVDGVEGVDTVTVFQFVGSVSVEPLDRDTLNFIGDQSRFQAVAWDTSGIQLPLNPTHFRWESGDASVAIVDSTGLVTAAEAGTAWIRAMVSDRTDSADVVVDQVVASVVVDPDSVTLPGDGATFQLGVALSDSAGHSVTNTEVNWVSGNPLVVDVEASGLITASASSGQTPVWAETAGVADTAHVSVVAVAAVEVEPTPVILGGVGDTVQLSAIARDDAGTEVPNVPFSWSSDDPDAASVNPNTGFVTGLERAVVTIAATAGDQSGNAEISVGWRSVHPGKTGDPATYTCALEQSGSAYCWGSNARGQFGDGMTADAVLRPVPAAGSLRLTTLDAGSRHACGVTTSAVLYCWGANDRGQLGDGSNTSRLNPVQVAAAAQTFVTVKTFDRHTCARAAGGSVYCWGANDLGQLGIGTTMDETVPRAVPMSLDSIFVGGSYSCGLRGDGKLHCWGLFAWPEFGDTLFVGSQPVEVFPPGLGFAFQSVAGGANHSCGATRSGALVHCWGRNANWQLGDPELRGDTLYATPQLVRLGSGTPLSGADLLTASRDHNCALVDGAAYCWGPNGGRIGNGGTESHTAPPERAGTLTFESLAAGAAHTCGVTTTGYLYCWGVNGSGEVGDGTTTQRLVPTKVLRPSQ